MFLSGAPTWAIPGLLIFPVCKVLKGPLFTETTKTTEANFVAKGPFFHF